MNNGNIKDLYYLSAKELEKPKLPQKINNSNHSLKAYKKGNQKTVLFLSVEKKNVKLVNLLLSNKNFDVNILSGNLIDLKESFKFIDLSDRTTDIVSIFENVERCLNNEKDSKILIYYFFI